MVPDTTAEREKRTQITVLQELHKRITFSSFFPVTFKHAAVISLISDRVRREAWANTKQTQHTTRGSEGLRHKRNQQAASAKFCFYFSKIQTSFLR